MKRIRKEGGRASSGLLGCVGLLLILGIGWVLASVLTDAPSREERRQIRAEEQRQEERRKARMEDTIREQLEYLKDVQGVEWVVVDGHQAFVGWSRDLPQQDWMAIVNAAAIRCSKPDNVTVCSVYANASGQDRSNTTHLWAHNAGHAEGRDGVAVKKCCDSPIY